eukprot:COSAG02_NODE_68927_length_212_cov_3.814159_1_plen_44_part_10
MTSQPDECQNTDISGLAHVCHAERGDAKHSYLGGISAPTHTILG